MSKKVNVNEAKVLELWSNGYNDKQVRMSLGLSVSTWDRWKKSYKQRTEVSTEVSEVSSSKLQSQLNSTGVGGVRYKYTDSAKYEEFKKDESRKAIEAANRALGKGYGLNQKAPERKLKVVLPEELKQYTVEDVPYDIWSKYEANWKDFYNKYGNQMGHTPAKSDKNFWDDDFKAMREYVKSTGYKPLTIF